MSSRMIEDSPDGILNSVPWETRNLERPAYQVAEGFLTAPDETKLRDALASRESHASSVFVQARIGKKGHPALPILQRCGFCFAEVTLHPHTRFQHNQALVSFKENKSRFLPRRAPGHDLAFLTVSGSDTGRLLAVKTIAGESFSEDRFHRDSRCDKATADRRYVLWVEDMFGNPNVRLSLLEQKGSPIGFMAREGENLLLAGFLRSHVKSGFGDFLWLSTLAEMESEGLWKAETTISAAHTTVLNLYARLGFKFRDPETVLHYWTR